MLSKSSSLRGVTLLEIVVSLVLLSLVMAGMANLFISSKRWSGHSGFRLSGAGLASEFLAHDNLSVSADDWDTTSQLGTCVSFTDERTLGTTKYSALYTVSNGTGSTGAPNTLRRVVLNISWNETEP